MPYPTRLPAGRPYPTMLPRPGHGSADLATIMALPGYAVRVDLAVHPTEGWPAVAVLQRFSESQDPMQVYVRAVDPAAGTWATARQVDVDAASTGVDRFGGVAIGITGDRTITVVWGASDPVIAAGGAIITPGRLWLSESRDYGRSWSVPQPLLDDCWQVQDLATTAEGGLVVLAHCYRWSDGDVVPGLALVVRHPDGRWEPPFRGELGATFGSVVLAGDGTAVTAVALISDQRTPYRLALLSRRLDASDEWTIQTRDMSSPSAAEDPLAGYAWHVRGLVFSAIRPDGMLGDGILFTWTAGPRQRVFALTSLDGGQTWGSVEELDATPLGIPAAPEAWPFVAPAYDADTQRAVAIWSCCGDAHLGAGPATHYTSWSVPGSGVWSAPIGPLITGARQAGMTVSAQAANASTIWLAWIEGGRRVEARSLALGQLVPHLARPVATPRGEP